MIKIGTALTLVGSIVAAVASFVASVAVTRPELEEVSTKVDTLDARTARRFQSVDRRQDDAEAVLDLIPAIARLQCLQQREWRSMTMAEAAGLPCDSLLRRIGR